MTSRKPRVGRPATVVDDDEEELYYRYSKKGAQANHLLNYSFVERNHPPSYSRSHHYYNDYQKAVNSSFYSKEKFIQANFQFVVDNQFFNEQDADQIANWDQLKLVIYFNVSSEIYQCPICLDHPKAPKITKCGHIFCWTCLLHLFEATVASEPSSSTVETKCGVLLDVEQKYKQCPLCTEMITLPALKSVKILITPKKHTEGSLCEFTLLKRYRTSMIPRPTETWSANQAFTFPNHLEKDSTFCRFHLDSTDKAVELQTLEEESRTLTEARLTAEESELPFIETADIQVSASIQQLRESVADHKHANSHTNDHNSLRHSNHNENDSDSENYVFFYQESLGQKLFLHPLCVKALLNEYHDYAHFPPAIKGKIIEMEEISLTESTRKRYAFLSHLPVTSVCCLCEIDMRNLVSEESLAPVLPQIKQRLFARKKKQQLETKELQKALKKEQNMHKPQQFLYQEEDFTATPATIADHILISQLQEQDALESAHLPPAQWVPNSSSKSLKAVRSSDPNTVELNDPLSFPSLVSKKPPAKRNLDDSDEELAPPAFSSSFYVSVASIPSSSVQVQKETVPQGSSQAAGGKRKKGQRQKKQLLFSTAHRNYA